MGGYAATAHKWCTHHFRGEWLFGIIRADSSSSSAPRNAMAEAFPYGHAGCQVWRSGRRHVNGLSRQGEDHTPTQTMSCSAMGTYTALEANRTIACIHALSWPCCSNVQLSFFSKLPIHADTCLLTHRSMEMWFITPMANPLCRAHSIPFVPHSCHGYGQRRHNRSALGLHESWKLSPARVLVSVKLPATSSILRNIPINMDVNACFSTE